MVNKNKSESEAEKCSMKSFQTDVEKKMEETKTENKDLKLVLSIAFYLFSIFHAYLLD